jgi:hypothetical protein
MQRGMQEAAGSPEQIHQTFAISLPLGGYSKDGSVGGIALNTKPDEP